MAATTAPVTPTKTAMPVAFTTQLPASPAMPTPADTKPPAISSTVSPS